MTDTMQSFTSMIRGLSHPDAKRYAEFSVSISNLRISSFQPRKDIKDNEIKLLAKSIEKNGLINPITVRASKEDGIFEIIAGERRYRAVVLLGWDKVSVIIKQMDDKSARAVALVENLQREDLNPVEEATGYKELLEHHSLTHDQVAELLGKPRSTISNFIRLLDLEDSVRDLLKQRHLDVGHAKLLVSLSREMQINLAEKVVAGKLSVRQLESLIKKTLFKPAKIKLPRVAEERFNDLAMYLKRRIGGDFEVEISNSSKTRFSFSDEECYDKFIELIVKLYN